MPKARPTTTPKLSPTQSQLPYPKRPPVRTATSRDLAHNLSPKPDSASHLYTDDNPSTTLHGTGFKDAATALHTLEIISQRSLTYQWQVVNTMYNRAKHHPARKQVESGKAQGRQFDEAMAILKGWLDGEYVNAKSRKREDGREFKPLLKKETVKRYLERLRKVEALDVKFAEIYVSLPKGKRLANQLVNDSEPGGRDWEIMRELELTKLAEERAVRGEEKEDGLWDEEKGGCSEWHLKCVAWAWSPVGERRIPP